MSKPVQRAFLFTFEALQNNATRLQSIQKLNMNLTAKMGTVQNRAFVKTLPSNYISAALKCRELSTFSVAALHEAQLERNREALESQFRQNDAPIVQQAAEQVQQGDQIAGQLKEAMRIATAQKEVRAQESDKLEQARQEQATQQREQDALQEKYDDAGVRLAGIEADHGQVLGDIQKEERRSAKNDKILLWGAVAVGVAAAAAMIFVRATSSKR